MRKIAILSLAFLYALFFVAGLPGLLRDYLFYRSDIFSLSVFVSAAALAMLPLTATLFLIASKLPGSMKDWIIRWAGLIAAVGITDIFLASLLIYLVGAFNLTELQRIIHHPLLVVAGCLLPAALLVLLQSERDQLVTRVTRLGCFALLAAPLLVACSVLLGNGKTVSAKDDPGKSRHLALVVLDGWPSQYLSIYNPDTPVDAYASITNKARIYLGARTSAVWTNSYFGALYTGNTKPVHGTPHLLAENKSLAASLQESGVGVRLMNFHRNGIPEASSARHNDHKGLRSYYLTENYLWIPHALGLDYHVALSGGAIGQNFTGVARTLFDKMNASPPKEHSNILIDVFMPELRRMRQRYNKGFSLFHIAWNNIGSGIKADEELLPRAQNSAPVSGGGNIAARVRANDYRYDPGDETYAAGRRKSVAKSSLVQAQYLHDFLKALQADPLLKDTVLVLTADHGSMYSKGRFWYGFHPHQEVVRVPFLVFDEGGKAPDNNLFATPAITKAIRDFFGKDDGKVIFAPKGQENGPVFSLTQRSDIHKEWILVATYRDKVHWLNLHPQGGGKTHIFEIKGYKEIKIGEEDGPPEELAPDMTATLKSFGIAPESVHQNFH